MRLWLEHVETALPAGTLSAYMGAMSTLNGRPFRKMNGLGNDFVIFDGRAHPITVTSDEARAIADRTTGIGCDQLIVLEPSPAGADVFMRIYNADGSQVAACGNATRCVARIVMQASSKSQVAIETNAGFLTANAGEGDIVTVDMGVPRLAWNEIPLAEMFHDTRTIELQVGPIDAPLIHSPSAVNMGNPHVVFFVDDLTVVDLAKVGPMLEHHPLFPERANISLAHVVARDQVELVVWERGAGLTKACGTAACAVVVAGVRRRLLDRVCHVHLPGGKLAIEWRADDSHVLMSGPSALEFEGEISARHLQGVAA